MYNKNELKWILNFDFPLRPKATQLTYPSIECLTFIASNFSTIWLFFLVSVNFNSIFSKMGWIFNWHLSIYNFRIDVCAFVSVNSYVCSIQRKFFNHCLIEYFNSIYYFELTSQSIGIIDDLEGGQCETEFFKQRTILLSYNRYENLDWTTSQLSSHSEIIKDFLLRTLFIEQRTSVCELRAIFRSNSLSNIFGLNLLIFVGYKV